jgi:hypothetical protein
MPVASSRPTKEFVVSSASAARLNSPFKADLARTTPL